MKNPKYIHEVVHPPVLLPLLLVARNKDRPASVGLLLAKYELMQERIYLRNDNDRITILIAY